jgi:hypothetical protein
MLAGIVNQGPGKALSPTGALRSATIATGGQLHAGREGVFMLRCACLLVVTSLFLGACAAPVASATGSLYRCDRNGDREQRVAC